jgi:hypothetical protein
MNQMTPLRLVNRLLNGSTATGDAYPGVSVLGYTGQVPQYLGQLGVWEWFSFAEAQKRSDPAVTQSLQGGKYQYVQHAADGTNYAQGQVLYWKDETNYIVTNVAPSAVSTRIAGICVAPVTQGNYWVIQTEGVAWVQYRATVTDTAADDLVVIVVNTNTADALAPGSSPTDKTIEYALGSAKDAPANGALGRVYLRGLVQVA